MTDASNHVAFLMRGLGSDKAPEEDFRRPFWVLLSVKFLKETFSTVKNLSCTAKVLWRVKARHGTRVVSVGTQLWGITGPTERQKKR